MTITTEQVALLADRFAEQRDIEADTSSGRHHGIPWAWVELAARAEATCCPNQSDPGPAWDWVTDQSGNLAPSVEGTRNAQCGQCGQLGLNWVTSGARPVDLDTDTEAVEELLEEMFAEVDQRRTERLDELVVETIEHLTALLAGAVELRDSSGEVPGYVGNMTEPGVGVDDDGKLVAWAYDPRTPDGSECIEVAEGAR
jgi:hypothetical protein